MYGTHHTVVPRSYRLPLSLSLLFIGCDEVGASLFFDELPLLLSIGTAFLIMLELSWTASGAVGGATWRARASACTGRWASEDLLLLLDDRLEGPGLADWDFLPINPSCFRHLSRISITRTSGAVSIEASVFCFLAFLSASFLVQRTGFSQAIANWL